MEQTYVVRNEKGQELFNTEWGTEWVQAGSGTRMQKGRADAEAKRCGGRVELAEAKRFCVLSDKGELRVEGRSARWVPFGLGSRLTKRHAVTLAEAAGGKKNGVAVYLADAAVRPLRESQDERYDELTHRIQMAIEEFAVEYGEDSARQATEEILAMVIGGSGSWNRQ